MKNILSVDPGIGDFKIVYGASNDNISTIYKFNSVLAPVSLSEHVTDNRVYNYNHGNYYIGDLALKLPSADIIDLMTYEHLEIFSPLLIKYTIDSIGKCPDIIVCGLSIAHSSNSGYYKQAIKKYLIDECKLPIEEVYILPQGIGSKLTIDNYGMHFPKSNTEFTDKSNYLIADLGFNTIDIVNVIEGKATSSTVRGIENAGVSKIAFKLAEYIKTQYNVSFSLKESKEILDRGKFKVRNNEFIVIDAINEIKVNYLEEVKSLVEKEFGSILDKTDKLRIVGGGAYLFQDLKDSFIETPSSRCEYYNAIGNYIYGCTKV